MKRINKAISILVVFVIIGSSDICYPETLRVPIDTKYDGMKSFLDSQMPYLDAFVDKLRSPTYDIRAQAVEFHNHVLHPILEPEGNIHGREYLIAELEHILKEIKTSSKSFGYGADPTYHINYVLRYLRHEIGTRSENHSYYIQKLVDEVSVGGNEDGFIEKIEAITETGLTNVLTQLREALLNKLKDTNAEDAETINRLEEALKIINEKSQPALSDRQKLIGIVREYFEAYNDSIREGLYKLGISHWTVLLVGSSGLKDEIMMPNYSDVDIALVVEFSQKEIADIKQLLHEVLGASYAVGTDFMYFSERNHPLAIKLTEVIGKFSSWKAFKEHHLFISPIGIRHFLEEDAPSEESQGGYYLYYYWLVHSEEEIISSGKDARKYLEEKARYFMEQNGIWPAYLSWLDWLEIKKRIKRQKRLQEITESNL